MGPLKQLALLAIVATFATLAYAERRAGKSIGIFNIVKFDNDVCNAAAQNMNGTCYTAEECAERDGTASGSCADGYGVCCIIEVSCGGRTSENCTYLTQTPSASPAVDSDDLDDQCSYTICPRTSSVNRIRLEFATFMLAPPVAPTSMDGTAGDGTGTGTAVDNQDFAIGQCNTDSFSVGNSPVICGVNDGQHMVVDTDGTDCVTALFTFGGGTVMRGYTIHVLQFDITNEMGGPPGCLQFFTGEMGTVSTFNWQTPTTSTHLANQNYDVCVRKLIDRCAICWSPATTGNGENGAAAGNGVPAKGTPGSFGINNGGFSTDGEGKSGQSFAQCAGRTAKQIEDAPDSGDSDDFIIIPLGIPPGNANANLNALIAKTVVPDTIGDSLFCGRFLNAELKTGAAPAGTNFDGTVCSRVTPFTLGVRFDDREATGSTQLPNQAAAAAAAAAGKQAKQEASSKTNAGTGQLSEPLGTAGFSLGFAQIAC